MKSRLLVLDLSGEASFDNHRPIKTLLAQNQGSNNMYVKVGETSPLLMAPNQVLDLDHNDTDDMTVQQITVVQGTSNDKLLVWFREW